MKPVGVVGAAMIVMGICGYSGVDHWMKTRILQPVQMPMSLAKGHVYAGPFRLNLRTDYWVEVNPGEWWYGDRQCWDTYRQIKTRWLLYDDMGAIVARSDDAGAFWAIFHAGPGIYKLDLEVLSDTGCFDQGRPHLSIKAWTGEYETATAVLKTTASIIAFVGTSLLIFLPIVRVMSSRQSTLRISDSQNVAQHFQWARTLPLARPITGFPAFGALTGTTFAVLAVLMMMLTRAFIPIPKGLRVRLIPLTPLHQKSDAWADPIIVRVERKKLNEPPTLFINSRRLDWKNLEYELKQKLAVRSQWTVYVGGDDTVNWQDVARVIDVAHGYGANVVLLTTREN